jgi:hypothetical protein
MDSGKCSFLMALDTRGNGKMANNMVKANFTTQMVKLSKENGLMVQSKEMPSSYLAMDQRKMCNSTME